MPRRSVTYIGAAGRRRAQQVRQQAVRAKSERPRVAVFEPGLLPQRLRAGLFAFGLTLLMVLMLVSRVEAKENEGTLADLAAALQDSVVNISTSQKVENAFPEGMPQLPEGSPGERRFKEFLERRRQQQQRQRNVSSLGSGFVIDASGLIVTNNHVIKDADEIFINFVDGTKLKVEKVLGVDAKSDIALLQVKPEKPLKAVKFGSSKKARVGDWVMAIGNPFGLGGTVTIGIVSAKNRDINAGPYDEFIQTDAAINRGNSGGPLFNMAGEVIGVNTAIISPSGGSIGIGFSVPSDTVVNIVDQLKKYGETRRGWLGVLIQRVTPDIAEGFGLDKPTGALIARVTKGGPAEKAGLQAGDIILEFDGNMVKSSRVLPKIVALTPVDKSVKVKVLRGDQELTVDVSIALLQVNKTTEAKLSPDQDLDEESDQMELAGLTLGELSGEFRRKYRISNKLKGVAILAVDPESEAAKKGIRAGHVIVDVMHESVTSPEDVMKKVEKFKGRNGKSIIFYISRGNGEFGFVALPANPAG